MCQITITAVNLLKVFITRALHLQFSLISALHFLFSCPSSLTTYLTYTQTQSYQIESGQLRVQPHTKIDPTQPSIYCELQMVLENIKKAIPKNQYIFKAPIF